MIDLGGFTGRIGEAALYADAKNLELLVNAFPDLFMRGEALEKATWTAQSSTSKTEKTARLKLVWKS
jgi:hypothetical protein